MADPPPQENPGKRKEKESTFQRHFQDIWRGIGACQHRGETCNKSFFLDAARISLFPVCCVVIYFLLERLVRPFESHGMYCLRLAVFAIIKDHKSNKDNETFCISFGDLFIQCLLVYFNHFDSVQSVPLLLQALITYFLSGCINLVSRGWSA